MSRAPHGDLGPRTRRRDVAVLRGAFAAGFVRLVTAGTSYVTLAIAARTLTKDEFGLVAVMISLWLILTMFDMGLGGALATRVATSHGRDDLAEVRAHVTHALLTLAVIGGFIAVAGAVSAVTLPWQVWIGGDIPSSTLVRSLVITFVVSGAALPAAVGYLCLSGMQRFATAQFGVAVGGLSAMIASAVMALAHAPPDVFVLAVLGSPLLVSLGFTAWIVFGELRGVGPAGGFEAARFRSMMRASGYYALYNAGNTANLGTSTMIVGSVRGLEDAAVFTVAIRLFTPIITVIAASGAQLWPSMTEAISRGDVEWARSRYRRGLLYVTGVSSAASLALVAVGPWFAELWVGPALVPPLNLFVWTAVFTVAVAVTSQTSVVLMAVERVRAAAALSVCTAIAGVAASVVLTRTIGASGAVIGATAACLGILLPGVALLARDSLKALETHADSPRL